MHPIRLQAEELDIREALGGGSDLASPGFRRRRRRTGPGRRVGRPAARRRPPGSRPCFMPDVPGMQDDLAAIRPAEPRADRLDRQWSALMMPTPVGDMHDPFGRNPERAEVRDERGRNDADRARAAGDPALRGGRRARDDADRRSCPIGAPPGPIRSWNRSPYGAPKRRPADAPARRPDRLGTIPRMASGRSAA